MTNRRLTVPEGQVAILLPVQLAGELQSLTMTRRRKLGIRMSRLTQAEKLVEGSADISLSVERQDKWQEAKIERDILNDLLLALVDGMCEYNR